MGKRFGKSRAFFFFLRIELLVFFFLFFFGIWQRSGWDLEGNYRINSVSCYLAPGYVRTVGI